MYLENNRYVLVGTVYGRGYNCEGGGWYDTQYGRNSKVSHWVDWIRIHMQRLNESVCYFQP